jgi:hypothetical protein
MAKKSHARKSEIREAIQRRPGLIWLLNFRAQKYLLSFFRNMWFIIRHPASAKQGRTRRHGR